MKAFIANLVGKNHSKGPINITVPEKIILIVCLHRLNIEKGGFNLVGW